MGCLHQLMTDEFYPQMQARNPCYSNCKGQNWAAESRRGQGDAHRAHTAHAFWGKLTTENPIHSLKKKTHRSTCTSRHLHHPKLPIAGQWRGEVEHTS